MLFHVENSRHFETMKDPRRKDGFEEIQHLAQYGKSKLRNHLYQYGVESKIDSTQNDGSQSWIVISRGR